MSMPLEHQLHHLVFDDLENFVSAQPLPFQARMQQMTPLPYMTEVGDVGLAFIVLYRRVGQNRGVGIPVQYTVRVGGTTVLAMTRDLTAPLYGVLHYRKDHLGTDLAHLRTVLVGERTYREMTQEETKVYAEDAPNLMKKRIRLADADLSRR